MNKADAEYITVGKIGATYGIKGWLKIRSYTELEPASLSTIPGTYLLIKKLGSHLK